MQKLNRSLFSRVLPVLLTFFFLMTMEVVQAQQRQISGTVKDAKGSPVASVTVAVKGNPATAITADDGSFTISAKDGDVLVFSSVSFETAEVKVTSASSSYDVVLTTNTVVMTDVVVVGYGTQNKKDVTGAVKTLKSGAFNKGIINSPQQLLQGKVAGVNVTSVSGEPGGNLGITIRGPGGVRTSNTPLFVVDGIPLDNSATGRGDPLNFFESTGHRIYGCIERCIGNGDLWSKRCKWCDYYHNQKRKSRHFQSQFFYQPWNFKNC